MLYCIGMNDNKIINLDVLNMVLDATTPSNLARINAKDTAPRTATPLTKDQAGRAKRMHAKWQAHTTSWFMVHATHMPKCLHTIGLRGKGGAAEA